MHLWGNTRFISLKHISFDIHYHCFTVRTAKKDAWFEMPVLLHHRWKGLLVDTLSLVVGDPGIVLWNWPVSC